MALMPAHLLKSDPDIGLDVFDKMSEVDRAVGVGQGAGDKDFAWFHWCVSADFADSAF
jgi:hypothetical protein